MNTNLLVHVGWAEVQVSYDTTSFDEPCWVGVYNEYLYIEPTYEKLMITLLQEWCDDKHLVG